MTEAQRPRATRRKAIRLANRVGKQTRRLNKRYNDGKSNTQRLAQRIARLPIRKFHGITLTVPSTPRRVAPWPGRTVQA